jgi:[protein-PII] uridylyltransferase
VAGRREDRLVFDLQTAVAQSFGFAGNGGARLRGADAALLLGRQGGHAAHQILLLNIEERSTAQQAVRP